MRFLASVRWRLFLVAWIVYSVHFATNSVREHYPAFSLVDHGTFRVDEYQGFHSDIFVHRDGHSVIGNQVLVSALAAIPLFIFDPVLDQLEAYSKERLRTEGVTNAEYRIAKPMRQEFFRLVKERGLDLRFGGVFPNVRRAGDVLRLQYLHDASVHADDVRLASEAGTRLLRYVLADAP